MDDIQLDSIRMILAAPDLIDQIFDIWDNIEHSLVEKLANSANKRVNAVLKLNGKVSKY
jgi:hypothetical protein